MLHASVGLYKQARKRIEDAGVINFGMLGKLAASAICSIVKLSC